MAKRGQPRSSQARDKALDSANDGRRLREAREEGEERSGPPLQQIRAHSDVGWGCIHDCVNRVRKGRLHNELNLPMTFFFLSIYFYLLGCNRS